MDTSHEQEPPPAATPLTRDAASAPQGVTHREILIGIAAVGAAALLTLGILNARGGAASASDTAPVPRTPAAATTLEPGGVAVGPTWSDANRAEWLGEHSGMAYEVPADRTVGVWMRAVRPSLVVRCAGRGTELFVYTNSAAAIERDTEDHTIRLRVDEGEEQIERWQDADEHDALFAPDGAAFAGRLAGARTLTFGFTPHNAPAVTVRFNVAGLEPLLARAVKACRAPALRK